MIFNICVKKYLNRYIFFKKDFVINLKYSFNIFLSKTHMIFIFQFCRFLTANSFIIKLMASSYLTYQTVQNNQVM